MKLRKGGKWKTEGEGTAEDLQSEGEEKRGTAVELLRGRQTEEIGGR